MIRFGPSGNDELYYEQGLSGTENAAKWVKEFGLDAYEYSCGRGVNMSIEKAKIVAKEFQKYDVAISVHAPYYINFANPDEEMVNKSYMYVVSSLNLVKNMGGNRIVVHPGACGKLERDEAVELTKKRLKILAELVKQSGFGDCYICLETMGKHSQIGTYQEVIDFCTIDDVFLPTFDFGHINAYGGGSLKTKEDFKKIIDYCIDKIGLERTKKVHIHFSKIMYSEKGEVKHLTFEDTKYGPEFEPLAEVIKEYGLEPVIICESHGIMAQDALKMKEIYRKVLSK